MENKDKNKTSTKSLKNISQSMVSGLQNLIKQVPELFIDTMSAREDRRDKILIDKILLKMFPEL
ncbi:MAG: hypothetical protein GXP45_04955 [bacterium]|nr:hypothetical protein [bacterium]